MLRRLNVGKGGYSDPISPKSGSSSRGLSFGRNVSWIYPLTRIAPSSAAGGAVDARKLSSDENPPLQMVFPALLPTAAGMEPIACAPTKREGHAIIAVLFTTEFRAFMVCPRPLMCIHVTRRCALCATALLRTSHAAKNPPRVMRCTHRVRFDLVLCYVYTCMTYVHAKGRPW